MTSNYYFIKNDVSNHEFNVHQMISNMDIVNVPQIYDYDKDTKTLKMRRIPNMCVADMYGENFDDIPEDVTEKIRDIIGTLYLKGVEYPDITGYNFIEYQDKVWIIDFEHASFNSKYNTYDPFIKQFIQGHNGWNPRFA